MDTTAVRDLIAALEPLDSLAAVKRVLDQMLPSLGYFRYTYVTVDIGLRQDRALGDMAPDAILLTNLDPNWIKRYADRRYFEDDPITRSCYAGRQAVIWTAADNM